MCITVPNDFSQMQNRVAGVRIENRLFENSLENMVKLHEALALNGIGRDISLYFRLK